MTLRRLPMPLRRRALEALYDPRRPDLAIQRKFWAWKTQPAGAAAGETSRNHAGLVDSIVDRKPGTAPLGQVLATSSVESPTMQHVATMLGFERCLHQPSVREAVTANAFFQWGARPSFGKARIASVARGMGRPLLHCEDGILLRSIDIGLSGTPCLALYIDDTTAYYDATRRSRLTRLLAGGEVGSEAAIARSILCIEAIGRNRLSKYNHAPDHRRSYGPAGRAKVLLVDQRRDDASVAFGNANAADFRRMLEFALLRWPHHQLLLKRHPDQISGGRRGYFDDALLSRQRAHARRITVVDEEVNPHTLFDQVEAVCVVTSGMGFEALLTGLPVHCFGSPFYAGWGATQDHAPPAPGRGVTRSVPELFHAIAVRSQVYMDPEQGEVVPLEEHIGRIAAGIRGSAR